MPFSTLFFGVAMPANAIAAIARPAVVAVSSRMRASQCRGRTLHARIREQPTNGCPQDYDRAVAVDRLPRGVEEGRRLRVPRDRRRHAPGRPARAGRGLRALPRVSRRRRGARRHRRTHPAHGLLARAQRGRARQALRRTSLGARSQRSARRAKAEALAERRPARRPAPRRHRRHTRRAVRPSSSTACRSSVQSSSGTCCSETRSASARLAGWARVARRPCERLCDRCSTCRSTACSCRTAIPCSAVATPPSQPRWARSATPRRRCARAVPGRP